MSKLAQEGDEEGKRERKIKKRKKRKRGKEGVVEIILFFSISGKALVSLLFFCNFLPLEKEFEHLR